MLPGNSFKFAQLKESVFLTARTTAMVCWLFIGSFTFSAVFAYLGGHEPIENFVLAMNLSPLGFMILAQIIIFILGWPLEWTEIIVIFMPIFLPLLKLFNIDPLFFGLLVALNIQTSFLSPPVAMAPFYLKGVAPSWVNINDIFRGVMPYMIIVIISMVDALHVPADRPVAAELHLQSETGEEATMNLMIAGLVVLALTVSRSSWRCCRAAGACIALSRPSSSPMLRSS